MQLTLLRWHQLVSSARQLQKYNKVCQFGSFAGDIRASSFSHHSLFQHGRSCKVLVAAQTPNPFKFGNILRM
jgi:hypothetical protein